MPAKSSKRMSRASRSRSRSRGRSKSRGRSPGRKTKASQRSTSQKKRDADISPTKRESETTPKRAARARKVKTPSTPTRQSARVAEQEREKEAAAKAAENADAPSKSESSDKKSSGFQEKVVRTVTVSDDDVIPNGFDFGGPVGAGLMIVALPAFVVLINLCCEKTCTIKELPTIPRKWSAYFDKNALLLYLAWLVFHFLLAMVPVGKVVRGQPLSESTKDRLAYRCNGFFAFLASVGAFGTAVYLGYKVELLYDKFIQLAVTAIVVSTVISMYLFIRARNIADRLRSPAGNTGNMLYDFFLGRELNPRIGNVDLKFICELRPGLIGWIMLNFVFVAKSCAETGGNPNPALVLVTAFQTWYVAEALWCEESILTTIDITKEGFGFMLAFGDLAWVPFLYTLQGKFLLNHPQEWSKLALAGFFVLNFIGYIIFRGSNSQKHRFRTNPYDPALASLETLPTSCGKRLLVTGWWGLCRHPNYLGDLVMALAWTLPCGFSHAVPYFYPVYFLLLLVDRANRAEKQCQQKYGAAWERYCQRVPYKIFPYIY